MREDSSLRRLTRQVSQDGKITWIGIRPARREMVISVENVEILTSGLVGDRRESPGKRAVTLIQHEHLEVISSLASQPASFALLRRNIAVEGINLLALRKAEFLIGGARLQGTGLCAPCTRMEEALGMGGFNAVRGHGGITAEVLEPGYVRVGAAVRMVRVL